MRDEERACATRAGGGETIYLSNTRASCSRGSVLKGLVAVAEAAAGGLRFFSLKRDSGRYRISQGKGYVARRVGRGAVCEEGERHGERGIAVNINVMHYRQYVGSNEKLVVCM